MYLVFTHMPGESYRRLLRSLLLCLCDVVPVLIKSLVCWFFFLRNSLQNCKPSLSIWSSQTQAPFQSLEHFQSWCVFCTIATPLRVVFLFFRDRSTLPVHFNSRWYICVRKIPYALHPVSQKFPQLRLWNGSNVLLTMALSRPIKEDRLALPLSTPLSSRRSMVWCPWLCAKSSDHK